MAFFGLGGLFALELAAKGRLVLSFSEGRPKRCGGRLSPTAAFQDGLFEVLFPHARRILYSCPS
jgi:hypothetical protein